MPQERRRVVDLEHAVADAAFGARVAVAEQRDADGGRQNPFGCDAFADERIDDRRFSGVEFADDHEQEQLVERRCRLRDGPQIRRSPVERLERAAQIGEQRAFGVDEGAPLDAEDVGAGRP